MSASIFTSHIAQRLKSLRSDRGISLDATAGLTGVSKAMLGQIEREESSPTIATLWKIASGLEVSFSFFFASEPRLCSDQESFPNDPNMKVKTLFPYAPDTQLEVFEITLTNGHQQLSESHSSGVIEHVHVLEGRLSVLLDGQWQEVNTGQSLRFNGAQQHGYHALSKSVTFHNIIRYIEVV